MKKGSKSLSDTGSKYHTRSTAKRRHAESHDDKQRQNNKRMGRIQMKNLGFNFRQAEVFLPRNENLLETV